jgi:hypothetical protein
MNIQEIILKLKRDLATIGFKNIMLSDYKLDQEIRSIIKGISNIRISDLKEYIDEIINNEYTERLTKALEKLEEEVERLEKQRKIYDTLLYYIVNAFTISMIIYLKLVGVHK